MLSTELSTIFSTVFVNNFLSLIHLDFFIRLLNSRTFLVISTTITHANKRAGSVRSVRGVGRSSQRKGIHGVFP